MVTYLFIYAEYRPRYSMLFLMELVRWLCPLAGPTGFCKLRTTEWDARVFYNAFLVPFLSKGSIHNYSNCFGFSVYYTRFTDYLLQKKEEFPPATLYCQYLRFMKCNCQAGGYLHSHSSNYFKKKHFVVVA